MIKKFKEKQKEFEAIQFDGSNKQEVEEFVGEKLKVYNENSGSPSLAVAVPTGGITSWSEIFKGDWVIKSQGRLEVIKEKEFSDHYDEIQ